MLKKFFAMSLLVGALMAPVVAAGVATQPVSAATSCDKKGSFLTFKPWYYGLTKGDCSIKNPSEVGLSKFVWTIVLNIVEDIMQLAGYIAVGFIIYGGFLYLTSAGIPDRATAGRKTVLNSVIGLIIAMSAVALVNLVARTALGLN